ncbi:hypothetical protein BDZ91DRAFT_733630, partial [Kalaharituber pfeilii]
TYRNPLFSPFSFRIPRREHTAPKTASPHIQPTPLTSPWAWTLAASSSTSALPDRPLSTANNLTSHISTSSRSSPTAYPASSASPSPSPLPTRHRGISAYRIKRKKVKRRGSKAHSRRNSKDVNSNTSPASPFQHQFAGIRNAPQTSSPTVSPRQLGGWGHMYSPRLDGPLSPKSRWTNRECSILQPNIFLPWSPFSPLNSPSTATSPRLVDCKVFDGGEYHLNLMCRQNNIVTRIVRHLRRIDLLSLVLVSKMIREGILLTPSHHNDRRTLPNGENADGDGISFISTQGNNLDHEDGPYQISPISPMTPLRVKVGSVIIPQTPASRMSGNRDEDINSLSSDRSEVIDNYFLRHSFVPAGSGIMSGLQQGHAHSELDVYHMQIQPPRNENLEYVDPPEYDYGNERPQTGSDEEYTQRLGRLVWLLSLTAVCKTPHRVPQQKVPLRFCVWCGECVCAVSYIRRP